jgi:hypothetical protein
VATRRRNTRRRNGTKRGAARKTARRAFLGLKRRKRTATKRRNPIRRKRNTMTKAKRRAAALKGWRKRKNTATKRRNTRKNSVARRRNSVARRRRNAPRAPLRVGLNRRRNSVARRRNSVRTGTHSRHLSRNSRRNTYAGLRRRRNTRRNASAATVFNNKLVAPVQRLVGRVPWIGKAAKGYVGPIMVGAGVGAAHYYAMMGLQKVAPQVMEKLSPVKYTASGIVIATVLRRVPVGDKKIRDQLAVGALLVGGALDVYRALSNKMGDLGDVDFPEHELYQGNPGYGALYEDGMVLDGIAADAIPPSWDGLAVQMPPRPLGGVYAGYGDGGAYDVVPLDDLAGEYASSNLGDAYALPADMSSAEGEAALGGAHYWRKRFGGPPHIRRQQASMVSPLAHRPGHRWGCIIKMIGFDRFQKIASLPPQQRMAVIASLKTQVQQAADEQLAMQALNTSGASPIAPPMAQLIASSEPSGEVAGLAINTEGLAADLGTPLYAGSVL